MNMIALPVTLQDNAHNFIDDAPKKSDGLGSRRAAAYRIPAQSGCTP
jgi:hypothetical protein